MIICVNIIFHHHRQHASTRFKDNVMSQMLGNVLVEKTRLFVAGKVIAPVANATATIKLAAKCAAAFLLALEIGHGIVAHRLQRAELVDSCQALLRQLLFIQKASEFCECLNRSMYQLFVLNNEQILIVSIREKAVNMRPPRSILT